MVIDRANIATAKTESLIWPYICIFTFDMDPFKNSISIANLSQMVTDGSNIVNANK